MKLICGLVTGLAIGGTAGYYFGSRLARPVVLMPPQRPGPMEASDDA